MILLTGAAGKTGRAFLAALSRCNNSQLIRAFVRNEAQRQSLATTGADEIIIGDLRNPQDVARACQGVSAIYFICPNMQPDELAIAETVFRTAKKAGVHRLLYHSVLHPQTVAMPHHWHKLQVEDLLFTTKLDYTIIQPAAYMQNVFADWQRIATEGIYPVPYATTTRLAMVDLQDVATVAATLLMTSDHSNATYELATDEWLTQDEVAAILSDQLERPVRAEQIERSTWADKARQARLGGYAIETLLKMFTYYEAYGFGGNGRVLTHLLGREPTRFADVVTRHHLIQTPRYQNRDESFTK